MRFNARIYGDNGGNCRQKKKKKKRVDGRSHRANRLFSFGSSFSPPFVVPTRIKFSNFIFVHFKILSSTLRSKMSIELTSPPAMCDYDRMVRQNIKDLREEVCTINSNPNNHYFLRNILPVPVDFSRVRSPAFRLVLARSLQSPTWISNERVRFTVKHIFSSFVRSFA